MVMRAFFVESMKSQTMRQLAAADVFRHVELKRPRWSGASIELVVDQLTVRFKLWWPWLLLPFLFLVVWLLWRWRIRRILERLKVPMRRVSVRVLCVRKKPKDTR